LRTLGFLLILRSNDLNDRPTTAGLILRALLEGAEPEIMPRVHRVRLLLAEVDCTGPLHNFLGHDVAALVRFQQKERVICIQSSTIAKPANTAGWNELMHAALNVETECVPRKPHSLIELSIGAVQHRDIVGVRVPRRPSLSVRYIGEDRRARRMNNNFVVSKQVRLLWVKAIRPMYVLGALCSVSIDRKSLVDWLRRLGADRNDGARHHHA